MTRPLAIITEPIDDACVRWLEQRCDVRVCGVDEPAFPNLLARSDALIVRTYTRVDRSLLERAPLLRVVGRAGVGLDNIDLDACRARSVRVVSTPDANSGAVVEYVFALMLDALRPRLTIDTPLDDDAWRRTRAAMIAPRQLSELTLGIYGMGRIGRGVARLAAALGMRTIYCDLLDIPEAQRHAAAPVARDALLRESDVLTLHVDGRPENRGLIDAKALALLKPNVTIINASRGFVVDAAALARFLRANPAAQAMLDVHEPEPIPAGHPLLGLPNARLYPHIGGATKAAHQNMSWVVRDVWSALGGDG